MSTVPDSTTPAILPAPEVAQPLRRGGAGGALLIALLALACAGYALWREHLLESGGESAAELQRLGAQVEALTHAIEKVRGNADSLRARMDDGDKVDKSAREELLGLSERARLLEDAVANLANKHLSGHDALLLNEAELLLTLGGERYTLFHDTAAAIVAYRLADTALSEVEDAAFSTVRQSIAGEVDALSASPATDAATLASQFAQLRQQLPLLPAATHLPAQATPQPPSRFWQVLGAFVQVRHGEDVQVQVVQRDANLARALAALDLREAEAAVMARDDSHYHEALTSARAQLAAFDPSAAAVTAAQGELDALDKIMLAPTPPAVLGTALKELRNLRATHALHAPSSAPATGGAQS